LDLLFADAKRALDRGHDPFGGFFAQLVARNELADQLLRRKRTVTDEREQILDGLATDIRQRLGERVALEQALLRYVVAPELLFEYFPAHVDGARTLLEADEVLDFVPGVGGDDEIQPVATRLVAGLCDDFDDVAVLEAGPQGHHLPV